ncbi:virulence protein [Syntrophomonas curvata]
METKIAYNVKGKERQELAKAVGEVLKTAPVYKGVPSCAYEIGDCLLDRQGTLLIGSSLDNETVNHLLAHLEERGFAGKAADIASREHNGLVISMPRDSFTDQSLNNLIRLAESKSNLLINAFGTDSPAPVITEDTVSFPWFPETTESDEVNAYTQFVYKLCEMARNQKRVIAQVTETDNEKYAFRCFLLRLGFIGSEYKTVRKILLRNLTGDSAFRHGKK